MKPLKFVLSIVVALICSSSLNSQVSVGYRNMRHIYVDYSFNKSFAVEAEHSLYAEKFGFQRIRIYGIYNRDFNRFRLRAVPYFGTIWNGKYQDFGAIVGGSYTFGRVTPVASVNPNYDTQLHFKFNYSGLLYVRIIDAMNLFGEFTTIPEYRISEKRVRLGGDFHVWKLSARPTVSLPVDKGGTKSVRVYCDFRYTF